MQKRLQHIILVTIVFLLGCSQAAARDYLVQYKAEHYKQTNQEYSNFPEVYHSIQISSIAGSKILILTGKDHDYRTWLRQFIAENKSFIVKVPQGEDDQFIGSKAYEIDVTRVHPYELNQWEKETFKAPTHANLKGGKRILIIDPDEKRKQLVASVINRIGYQTMTIKDPVEALFTFKQQPEKFSMIILDHQLPGMASVEFIRRVIAIDHQIPVLVGTGYNNPSAFNEMGNTFASSESVTVIPVILNNLSNRVKSLLDRRA